MWPTIHAQYGLRPGGSCRRIGLQTNVERGAYGIYVNSFWSASCMSSYRGPAGRWTEMHLESEIVRRRACLQMFILLLASACVLAREIECKYVHEAVLS